MLICLTQPTTVRGVLWRRIRVLDVSVLLTQQDLVVSRTRFPWWVQSTVRCVGVCVVAYQESTPNGFFAFHINPSLTINDVYIDGISLTHGEPRQHVWSFVAALDETGTHLSACHCSNLHNIDNGATVPPFIGEHYFCDTGSRGTVSFQFYEEDPLWDGSGCGQSSSCCSYNDPPWFLRQLSSPTADGLEMRVCRDAAATNENTPFQVVELYVR